MAIKLYPPQIEGTIPAFCTKNGTTELVVPFSLNRAVSKNEIAGFVIKIKTVQGGVLLWSKQQELNLDGNKTPGDTDELIFSKVTFQIPKNVPLIEGQYYKIQLAFASRVFETGELYTGYFSTVGVTKYTTDPKVEIFGLKTTSENNHSFYYTGIYNQDGKDTSEKLYSSRFKLTNGGGQTVFDSGEIIHNISLDDNNYEAIEEICIPQDLEVDKLYFLQYITTSTNGLVTYSHNYSILQKKSIPAEISASIKGQVNQENGCIDLYLVGEPDKDGYEKLANGDFLLCRAASSNNYIWENVYKFSLRTEQPSRFLWRDYTVEQGVTYKYSIQQYNSSNLYSERIISNSVAADFEDSFLYDGERQLKIKFNPKINSFKTDILENKIETIGSKYPFIFRNGNVNYKEFPISGLISYKMDDNSLFLKKSELELDTILDSQNFSLNSFSKKRIETTDMVPYNIYAERVFKIEVLNWLNNGKPKLFKSPSEGNFIVQLLGVSLSPEDALGRMLHNFSCTAYEIKECNFSNLFELGFVKFDNAVANTRKFATIELSGQDSNLDTLLKSVGRYTEAGVSLAFSSIQYNRLINYNKNLASYFRDKTEGLNQSRILNIVNLPEKDRQKAIKDLEDAIGKVTYVSGVLNSYPVSSIKIYDMLPGTQITIRETQSSQPFQIQIGVTGSYSASFDPAVYRIEIPQTQSNPNLISDKLQGSITISYDSKIVSSFETVEDLEVTNIPVQQWIGQQEKVYYDFSDGYYKTTNDLIKIIENVKRSITEFFWLRFFTRPFQKLFIRDLEIEEDIFGVAEEKYTEKGFYFEQIQLTKEEYQTKKYYTVRLERISGSSNYIKFYSLSRGAYDSKTTYYEKKCNKFYYDMDCMNEVNFEDLDCWMVYMICHGRFDYTYSKMRFEKPATGINTPLHFEQYYVDSNFNQGYYIDKDGKKTMIFTGILMDGKSTEDNKIFYNQDTYSYKVYINGEEVDLTEKGKLVLKDWSEPITSLYFDNGIICEASYQIRTTTYNIESSNEAVDADKAVYNYREQMYQKNLESSPYREEYLSAKENDTLDDFLQSYFKIEEQSLKDVNQAYDTFIKQLEIALFQQKQEEGI